MKSFRTTLPISRKIAFFEIGNTFASNTLYFPQDLDGFLILAFTCFFSILSALCSFLGPFQ